MTHKKFTPKPTDGCADCEWLTEELETTSVCDECCFEQRAEYMKMLDNPYRYQYRVMNTMKNKISRLRSTHHKYMGQLRRSGAGGPHKDMSKQLPRDAKHKGVNDHDHEEETDKENN